MALTSHEPKIIMGRWCPECGKSKKLDLEKARAVASKRGGKCLSRQYINSREKLHWKCSKKHQWHATLAKINFGQWCPKCGGRHPLDIEQMRSFANSKGGKCLSYSYLNNHNKLIWQCQWGHKWEAIPMSIQQGHWCPKCSKNKKLTIGEMKQLVKSKGGKCLSQIYTNSQTKLLWECREGHKWEAIPNSIKRGSWCFQCSLKNRKN